MKTKPKQKTIKAWAVVYKDTSLYNHPIDYAGSCASFALAIYDTKKEAQAHKRNWLSVRPVTITIE